MSDRKISRDDLRQATETTSIGEASPEDETGALNFTTAEDVKAAGHMVKKHKVISLALNFDHVGPQGGRASIRAWAAPTRSTP